MNATPLKPIAVGPSEAELRAVRASPYGWNDLREKMAERLYAQLGWSASQTATAIGGGLSRNAVIGKAYRSGWSGARDGVAVLPPSMRPTPSKPRAVAAPKPPKAVKPALRLRPEPAAFAPPPPPEPPMPDVMHDDTPSAVLALRLGDCRWPVGDPARAGFRFCCRAKWGALPYCREHAQTAYQPAQKKKSETALARSLRRFV